MLPRDSSQAFYSLGNGRGAFRTSGVSAVFRRRAPLQSQGKGSAARVDLFQSGTPRPPRVCTLIHWFVTRSCSAGEACQECARRGRAPRGTVTPPAHEVSAAGQVPALCGLPGLSQQSETCLKQEPLFDVRGMRRRQPRGLHPPREKFYQTPTGTPRRLAKVFAPLRVREPAPRQTQVSGVPQQVP